MIKHDKAVEFLEETRYMQAQGIYDDIEKHMFIKQLAKLKFSRFTEEEVLR